MLTRLLIQTCNILDQTEATTDRYEDDVLTFVNVSGLTFKCRVDPSSSIEAEVDRDTRKSMFKLFITPDAKPHINALSRVYVIEEDKTYEVFGEPSAYLGRHALDHLEVILRAIEG